MTRRYVILLHSGYGSEHLDLMIEQESALATWQIAQPLPPGRFSSPMPARRLADHRAAYLDYEGPVSRGRGHVRRIDQGTCDVLEEGRDFWLVEFRGGLLWGRWTMRCREGGDTWLLEPGEGGIQ